jgi:hypothetical protein
MSTELTSESESTPTGQGTDRARPKIPKRVWLPVTILTIGAMATGALIVLGWMVDETHFDRPSAQFDELEAQLEQLPGVDVVQKERWVEAPTFSSPTSWVSVTVDEAALPGLMEAACVTDYPDPVSWSIRVHTPEDAEVSLHVDPSTTNANQKCPDFGLDAVPLIAALNRAAPGLAVQPAIWENGRFALVAIDEEMTTGFTPLLPLVENADELRDAAGLGENEAVEVNGSTLTLVIAPGEADVYFAMLTVLSEDHGVTSYWADGGGTPSDGVEKVQIVAPADQHAAIEEVIRSSGLHIADFPLRFIEQ